MESLHENAENEIGNKICPYCNMVLTEDIFEDHIICHTIDILENHSQQYNINNYSENGPNSNPDTKNDKNIFDKFIDFFKTPTKQEESKDITPQDNDINNINSIDNNLINENNNNIAETTSNNTNENHSGISSALDALRSMFSQSQNRTHTRFKRNRILFNILNTIKNSITNEQNENQHQHQHHRPRHHRSNINNVNAEEEELRNEDELREDPFYQEHPELIKKDKNIDAILEDLPVSVITEETKKDSNNPNCVVCLNNFNPGDEVISLPCFHMFHKDCLISWLKKKLSCPVCKLNISLSSLHRDI